MTISDDPQRALQMTKPLYYKQQDEITFYRSLFEGAEHIPWRLDTLQRARELAQRHGIAAMDAIPIATAIEAKVAEFVSGEKPDKPLFRAVQTPVRSLRKSKP